MYFDSLRIGNKGLKNIAIFFKPLLSISNFSKVYQMECYKNSSGHEFSK